MSRIEKYSYGWSETTGLVGTYVVYKGRLVELLGHDGELQIPTSRWGFIKYDETLDGRVMSKKEALAAYPEEFI